MNRLIMNLTPHAIRVRDADGRECIYPPSGQVARVVAAPATVVATTVCGAPVVPYRGGGTLDGLPPPDGETAYLVSIVALAFARGRRDVYAPDTGPDGGAVRDTKGQIIAVTRFIAAPEA